MTDRAEHWHDVYANRAADEVSWYQPRASTSLQLIEACGRATTDAIVDVGAGASTLVDGLLERGFRDVTLVDIAESGLSETRRRLPNAAIRYIVADILSWTPPRTYDVWHDRAVFHFLTSDEERSAYKAALSAGLAPGGHVVIGTFAADGPERCSGLPVQRYSDAELIAQFQDLLEPQQVYMERHATPTGKEQSFVFVRFVRK